LRIFLRVTLPYEMSRLSPRSESTGKIRARRLLANVTSLTHGLRRPGRRAWASERQAATLERFPFERNRSNDKKSLKIKTLEQALIEKVYQLFRSLL
jgi:hypothetical protein